MPKLDSEILLKLLEVLAEAEARGEGGPTWRRAPAGTERPVFLHNTNAYLASTYYGSTSTESPIKTRTTDWPPWACDGTVVLTFNSSADAQFFADHYHWEKRHPRQGDIILMDEMSRGIDGGKLRPWTTTHDNDVRLCIVPTKQDVWPQVGTCR